MNNTQQAGETAIMYEAIPVDQELPPYPQIVIVLLDGRLEMQAQIRPGDKGPEWWTLGMAKATNIESNKKCVTHWLKRVSDPPAPDAVEAKAKAKKLYPDFKDEYGYPTHIKNMNGDVKKLRKAYLAGHTEGQKATVEAESAGVWVKVPIPTRATGFNTLILPKLREDVFAKVNGERKAGYVEEYYRGEEVDYRFVSHKEYNGWSITNMSSFEWLDETPTSHAEGEKGAVGFAEWIRIEGWQPTPYEFGKWYKKTGQILERKTSLELHNLYLTC